MKTNALLAFFFFFLVALFASTRAELVRDSEGHIVANGGIYYLMPQFSTGAAIVGAIIKNPNDSCSLAVVDKSLHNNGNATEITTKFITAYITTDFPLQISFNPLPSNPCTKTPDWLVTEDKDLAQSAVMVGAASEFPDPVPGGYFKFKTYDSARHFYNLIFCFNQYRCLPIAVEKSRLIVSAEPEHKGSLVVMLVKKSRDNVACDISMVV